VRTPKASAYWFRDYIRSLKPAVTTPSFSVGAAYAAIATP
jgi:hypothetical protein